MEAHARDKGTAAFLRAEYGDDLPAFPVTGAATDLPWPKVQRRLAQLMERGAFLEETELPAREVPDLTDQPVTRQGDTITIGTGEATHEIDVTVTDEQWQAIQEAIPEAGPEPRLGPSPSVREIFEHYLPIVKDHVLSDTAYQNACKNSDKENAYLEGAEAVKRAAISIEDANFLRLYYDLTGFHNSLHEQVLDETYPMLAQASGMAEQAQAAPDRDTDAPPYQVGDMVYLDGTAFEIKEIRDWEVQLLDPALSYPIFRAESRENFERLLRQDSRNGAITEFLASDLERINDDLRDVLASGLLTPAGQGIHLRLAALRRGQYTDCSTSFPYLCGPGRNNGAGNRRDGGLFHPQPSAWRWRYRISTPPGCPSPGRTPRPCCGPCTSRSLTAFPGTRRRSAAFWWRKPPTPLRNLSLSGTVRPGNITAWAAFIRRFPPWKKRASMRTA